MKNQKNKTLEFDAVQRTWTQNECELIYLVKSVKAVYVNNFK